MSADNIKLAAVSAGMSCILSHGGKWLEGYGELLEDDWNGGQAGLGYLKKIQDIMSVMLDCNDVLEKYVGSLPRLELVAVTPLLEGIFGELEHGGKSLLGTSQSGNSYILADAFFLQETLSDIICRNYGSQGVSLTSMKCQFSSGDLGTMHSELAPGEYIAIIISRLAKDGFIPEEYSSAMELRHLQGEELVSRIGWIGAAALHKGELLIGNEGGEVALLLPEAEAFKDNNLLARGKNGRMETILLVDDEDMIWDVVLSMLSDLGYTVLLANDGKEAVEIFRENRGEIDMVLLDMVMPVMTAREAFPLLKTIDPEVKVLLASGYVDENDVQDLLASGAMGFMRKPYLLKDLASRIRAILDKQ